MEKKSGSVVRVYTSLMIRDSKSDHTGKLMVNKSKNWQENNENLVEEFSCQCYKRVFNEGLWNICLGISP